MKLVVHYDGLRGGCRARRGRWLRTDNPHEVTCKMCRRRMRHRAIVALDAKVRPLREAAAYVRPIQLEEDIAGRLDALAEQIIADGIAAANVLWGPPRGAR